MASLAALWPRVHWGQNFTATVTIYTYKLLLWELFIFIVVMASGELLLQLPSLKQISSRGVH